MVLVNSTEKSYHRNILTERSFDRITIWLNTVIQNFGFPLPKHSGRQLLWKFRVQKFYFGVFNRNFGSFEPKLRIFRTETSFFLPETSCIWKPEFRIFLKQSFSFCKQIFFVLPILRVLIPKFFATETLEYQIHAKFLTKFRLSGNRRNSRSFGWK
jgi:hypothetical protein